MTNVTGVREFIRPGIGRVTTDRWGRWYEWDGNKYWSVTTIKGAMNNYGLDQWFKKYTAQFACENIAEITELVVDDRDFDSAWRWVRDACDRYTEKRAEIGTRIHDHAEAYVLNKPMPPIEGETAEETAELQSILESFYDFLAAFRPQFVMVEAPVFHTTEMYAGTLDNIADYDRNLFSDTDLRIILGERYDAYMRSGRSTIRLLGDYKTGRTIYDDVALQLAPYRYADRIGLPDGEMVPMLDVDGAIVIHLRDGVMEVLPVNTDPIHFKSFLYVREVYRWARDLHNGALGKPVELANQQIALDT